MDEELTPAQLSQLKAQLEGALRDVEQALEASAANAQPVDLELSIGRLSRVDAMQQQHMALAQRRRLEQQRQQIQSALSRVQRESYGACVRCEEPIGFARLSARPEGPLCRECQSGGEG